MPEVDLRYEPPDRGFDWLAQMEPESCLVVGDVADVDRDRIASTAPEVRTVSRSSFAATLHRGTYAYANNGSWHALILTTQGREPRGSDTGRLRFVEDGHLTFARMLHEELWPTAQPFAGAARFGVGDMVRAAGREEVGRVTEVSRTSGGYQYKVDVRGVIQRFREEALRLEAGDPSDPEFWLSQSPAGAEGLSLTLTWTKLRHPLTDTLYSFAASKTLFRAYQFRPVLKVLTGSSGRLLIADEVGLGKTIEAGLIWSELEQRNRLDRVLVVAPAALTLKWKAEMERRFDRRLTVLRPADLATFAEDLAAGKEPVLHGVVSLEALRAADGVLERLTELHPRIDLVIVDEAHYLRNRESKSHAMGRLLADWSDYLVFLSATPLNLSNDDLFNLVNLLDEASFTDRAVFQQQLEPNEILNDVARSLLDVGRHEPRKLVARLDDLGSLRFGSSVTERPDFAILRGILDVDRPLSHDEVARTRRLLADLNILGGVLTRTRKADTPDRRAVRQPVNIDVAWTEAERDYYNAVYTWYMSRARSMGTPPGFAMQMPLRQAASCIPASQQLIRQRDADLFMEFDDFDEEAETDLSGLNVSMLTAPLTVDTKYDRLLEELLRVRTAGLRQVMIFSFFRRTLAYLARHLGEHMPVEVMHGGVPMPERERIMRDFRAGRFDVLLLSEVGSEGLDFEFCNVLVNYDLPWNPMRVEQRIGRLDRFGQQHEKIFIYNMRVPGTIETDIFQRLYDRIGVFQSSIGELEPILRDQLTDITRRLLDPNLDATGRQREVDRIHVALEQRGHQLDELHAAQTQLSGLDGLLVEGLTDSGPSRGRFIGRAEIGQLLDELFRRFGGSCDQPDSDGIVRLVGSDRLAARLRSSMIRDGGSRHSRSKLAALLQSGTPILSTFDPETASRHDAELLSARHPLIKLAMDALADESLDLPRFGSVSVPGLPAGRRYLVAFDLAHTTGLRELLELWATAVDLDTRQLAPDVGEAVLTALAEGTLGDGSPERPTALKTVLNLAHAHVADRQEQAERVRGQENAALVDGRIRARESSLDLQIQKTKEIIGRLRAEGRAASIIRLQEGRLRNLRARRAEIADELSARRQLSVSLTAIAVVLAERTPEEPTPSPGTRRSAGRARSGSPG